jgi:hypothetical protein
MFSFLNLFDPIDRGCLALVEQPGDLVAAQSDHCRGQIVAQGREVSVGPRGDARGDLSTIDDHNPLAFDSELVRCGDSRDAGADDNDIAFLVALQGATSISIQRDRLRRSKVFSIGGLNT